MNPSDFKTLKVGDVVYDTLRERYMKVNIVYPPSRFNSEYRIEFIAQEFVVIYEKDSSTIWRGN